MFDFINTISDLAYGWCADANSEDFATITNEDVMSYLFIALLSVTLGAVLIFYYVVAKDVSQATKRNYLVIFFLGLLVLQLTNFIIIPTFIGTWDYAFGLNNIKFSLIDCAYYVFLYEGVSWFVKDKSNASKLHLFNCLY